MMEKINLELFIIFFKIGAFSYGGGYTLAPLIEREFIINRDWISKKELLEIMSISQMTPGVIAINTATFVGRKVGGVSGAIIASLGVTLPALFVIAFIVHFLGDSFNNPVVRKALTGIRIGAVAMIFYSVIGLLKEGISKFSLSLFTLALIALVYSKVSPIILIIIGGILGVVYSNLMSRSTKKLLNKEVA